jgi:predicted RNase H-like nuclease (RuvC/YqgF family)
MVMSDQNAKGDQSSGKSTDWEAKLKELETDNFKLREKNRELKSGLEGFETRLKTVEAEKNEKDNNWKAIAEGLKKDLEAKSAEAQQFKLAKVETKKNTAILNELNKLGFDTKFTEEAFKLIDKNKVIVDDESEYILGASDVAKEFATKYSTLGFFGKKQIQANHSSSKGNAPSLDVQSMTKEQVRQYYLNKQKGR